MNPFIASHLKDMNRKTVYQLFASKGEISKAEISRQTGISPPTVIKIIDFFLKVGLVAEAGEGDSALGRKPQLLRFNPEAAYTIGVEFDGIHLRAGLVDLMGNVKRVKEISAVSDFDVVVSHSLPECVHSVIAEAGVPRSKVTGVGLGIPGVVDADRHTVLYAPLIGITDQRSYAHEVNQLSLQLGTPIFFENDVNASAVGEFISRGLGVEDDLLHISLGSGLGAGIILNGRLRKGKTHSAGEIGYMVFDKDFVTSKAGAGWLESNIVMNPQYKRLQARASGAGAKSSVNADPDDTNGLMDAMADNLALGIANLSTMLDIEQVVLGGSGVERIGEKLLVKINEKLAKLCLNRVFCHLSQSDYPGIIGMAAIVNEAVLETLLEG